VATTVVDTRSIKQGALAGLAAYDDGENALGVAVGDGKVIVWRREKNEHKTIAVADAPNSPLVYLRMTATGGHRFRFAVGQNGQDGKEVGDKRGSYLPPWDHAVRVALTSGGIEGSAARFDWLRIVPSRRMPTLLAAGS
jgi:xylan 1,4-beta-xylosidase